jgi:hypothetical protein
MKTYDIVRQLQAVIPNYTANYADSVTVSALTRTGAVAIATATAHGLIAGDNVYIKGAILRNAITSITRVGSVATATTQYDNDLTLTAKEAQAGDTYITIGGATQAEYNGSKQLLNVIDSKHFTFEVAGGPATPATGSPYLIEDLQDLWNGVKTITKLSDNSFSYPLRKTPYADASGTISAYKNIRIAGGASAERCIAAYTPQGINSHWLFVVLGAMTGSKSRNNQSDSVSKFSDADDYRQNLYQQFSVYAIIPTSAELAARDTRDDIEDLRVYLFKALCGVNFPPYFLSAKNYRCGFVSDDVEVNEGAYYVHRFVFENTFDINEHNIVEPDLSVAFRSFEISQKNIDTDLEIRNIKGVLV